MPLIAPSILSADFLKLKEELKSIIEAGADILHIDIMDGHFVPNLTIGPLIVEPMIEFCNQKNIKTDIHLMVENTNFFIDLYTKIKPTMLSIHSENSPHLHRLIYKIKDLGIKAGVVLNPASPIENIKHIIDDLDFVLLMSVNPGFGGQRFLPVVLEKIKNLKALRGDLIIEIDGGINGENAKILKKAGADILVSGNYIFSAKDRQEAINSLR